MMALIISLHIGVIGALLRAHAAPPPALTATTDRAAVEPVSKSLHIRA